MASRRGSGRNPSAAFGSEAGCSTRQQLLENRKQDTDIAARAADIHTVAAFGAVAAEEETRFLALLVGCTRPRAGSRAYVPAQVLLARHLTVEVQWNPLGLQMSRQQRRPFCS